MQPQFKAVAAVDKGIAFIGLVPFLAEARPSLYSYL